MYACHALFIRDQSSRGGNYIRISAPPMAAVVVKPWTKLSAVFAERHAAAMAGAPGAMVRNAPIVPALAARRLELMICRPGRTVGRDDILPASLRKATMLPVNVIPPRGCQFRLSRLEKQEARGSTNKHTKIGSNHMQRGDFRDVSEHAADTCEDGGEADNRMECCHRLRELGGCDSSSDKSA